MFEGITMFSALTHHYLNCLSLLWLQIHVSPKKLKNAFQTRDRFAFCSTEKRSIEGSGNKIDLGQ